MTNQRLQEAAPLPAGGSVEQVSGVLHHIVNHYTFDSFVGPVQLAEVSTEYGIPLQQWPELLSAWRETYDPVGSIQRCGRGNCVDFALLAKQALAAISHPTDVIGMAPWPEFYSDSQVAYIGLQHVVLLGGATGARRMYEPGWNLPVPVQIEPVGQITNEGIRQFATDSLGHERLNQRFVYQGMTYTRTFDLRPLSDRAAADIILRLLRVPRRLEIATTYQPEGQTSRILYYPAQECLDILVDQAGTSCPVDGIGDLDGRKLERAFGFDVKGELLAWRGLIRQLPADFWVH